eukprot:690214-Amphidinium_carterae.1
MEFQIYSVHSIRTPPLRPCGYVQNYVKFAYHFDQVHHDNCAYNPARTAMRMAEVAPVSYVSTGYEPKSCAKSNWCIYCTRDEDIDHEPPRIMTLAAATAKQDTGVVRSCFTCKTSLHILKVVTTFGAALHLCVGNEEVSGVLSTRTTSH